MPQGLTFKCHLKPRITTSPFLCKSTHRLIVLMTMSCSETSGQDDGGTAPSPGAGDGLVTMSCRPKTPRSHVTAFQTQRQGELEEKRRFYLAQLLINTMKFKTGILNVIFFFSWGGTNTADCPQTTKSQMGQATSRTVLLSPLFVLPESIVIQQLIWLYNFYLVNPDCPCL